MAFDTTNGGDRPMFEGNWSCATCGAPITKLPFQPDEARLGQLKCRDCFRQSAGDRPVRDTRPERQLFSGNWQCATCGGGITELPFEPDPSRLGQLKCRDCHKAGR